MIEMLLLGFLGSAHCLGMCGGFVTALARGPQFRRHQVNYQVGRLLGYAFLGAVLGVVGMTLKDLWPAWGQKLALIMAGAVMIALGCGLHLKAPPLGRLLPWLGRLTRSRSREGSVLLGMVTSLLPCGLLYAAYARAAAASNPVEGGLLMATFWLGTVPALGAVGLLLPRQSLGWVRLASAATVVIGLFTVYHGVTLKACCH